MAWRYATVGLITLAAGFAVGSFKLQADLPSEPIATAIVAPGLGSAEGLAHGAPVTGLSRQADGTWWAGWGLAKPSPRAGAIHYSADFKQLLGYVSADALGLPKGSTQGVAVDGDTVWFVLKRTPAALLVHVGPDGNLISSTKLHDDTTNGLAIDTKRGQLIIMNDAGNVSWLDKSSLKPTGMGFRFTTKAPDHLFYNAARDSLLISHGENRADGHVTEFQLGGDKWEPGTSWTLAGADAIEGLSADGATLTITNDGGTHEGAPALNRVITYRIDRPN